MTAGAPTIEPIWLASRSPRRRELFERIGMEVRVRPAGIDDADVPRGKVGPRAWVMSLAYLKARWVAEALRSEGVASGTVIGADTLCVCGSDVLGQARSADEARAMLRRLCGGVHVTMTGVCLLALASGTRWMFVDEARVRVGFVADDVIDRYVESGEWTGKAGAYNLQDRMDAGWPITCEGDPATVMGLPIERLRPWIESVREASR